ncbi:MAG: hypothetical protein ACYTF0_08005 [Planctomycetota bacterium]|jgi:hypothetical protein
MTTDASAPSTPDPIDVPPTGFAFTDSGCRSEVRLGALLVMMAVFMWLFLGPTVCAWLFIIGAGCLLVGVPRQAFEARRHGRPGYPFKLGLTLSVFGAILCWDYLYREGVGQDLQVHYIAWMMFGSGLWMLAWAPLARRQQGAT